MLGSVGKARRLTVSWRRDWNSLSRPATSTSAPSSGSTRAFQSASELTHSVHGSSPVPSSTGNGGQACQRRARAGARAAPGGRPGAHRQTRASSRGGRAPRPARARTPFAAGGSRRSTRLSRVAPARLRSGVVSGTQHSRVRRRRRREPATSGWAVSRWTSAMNSFTCVQKSGSSPSSATGSGATAIRPLRVHAAMLESCGDVGECLLGSLGRHNWTLSPTLPLPLPRPASSCLTLPLPLPRPAPAPAPASSPPVLSPPVFVFVFFACTRPQGWQREGDGTGYCCSPPGPLRPRPKAPRNWGLNSPPGPAFFSPSLSPNARRGR